ncbi:hypothetical protein AB6A40_011781 [Gnathostoma spinigerum]|uniref:Immunoglobulin I-set domain-containing protein n=1 Tax=Gnathostoma spinigerum TaxID=75299 RepID=A0ABD6F4T9_9BILA
MTLYNSDLFPISVCSYNSKVVEIKFRYHNGAPLAAASRFRPMFDFGYVALDILYARPEDSGTYTLVAKNELGQVESTLELFVGRDQTLQLEPHHPEGEQY